LDGLVALCPFGVGLFVGLLLMLFLLSPAKSLDYETPAPLTLPRRAPKFSKDAAELIDLLRAHSPAQIAALMSLSDALAGLNAARYAAWSSRVSARNSKPAVLAFNGDVYDGLQASTLSLEDLAWADVHVRILSGLYGVLRPLDALQPYRLEMGTRLTNPRGRDLYAWWGERPALELNTQFRGDPAPVLVNLASQEYFKAVDRRVLKARVVECVFEDWKSGRYKIISFFAKRARGAMARYAILKRVTSVDALTQFDADGYAFDAACSAPDRLVFRRRMAEA
jgi:uncharacterized protein